jgi:hypothetical protein
LNFREQIWDLNLDYFHDDDDDDAEL